MKNDNVLTLFSTKFGTAPPNQPLSIAVVTHISDTSPASITVTINDHHYHVAGFLSALAGVTPGINPGDKVLISAVEDGVLIHGLVLPVDAPARASFGFKEGKLVIEAQGAVILKSGNATVELTEAGTIRIDGKDVRTVAKKTLTLLGSKINLN